MSPASSASAAACRSKSLRVASKVRGRVQGSSREVECNGKVQASSGFMGRDMRAQ
jgi:hypothetical protein